MPASRIASIDTPREDQRARRTHRPNGRMGNLERQEQMSIEVATDSFDVEHRASRIGGSRARHEDVIDRRELIEEPPESIEVGSVEGGDAGAQFEAYAIDTLRVTRREDHIGTFPRGSPRGLETDPRRSPDHQERLDRDLGFPSHAMAQSCLRI